MIVRNEEDILERAIESTRGLADEIVIVDTGSEDSTLEIAEKRGAIILTGSDRLHKGNARNRAIDVASGDWIVILDADEQIADPVGLRAFLEETTAQCVFIRLAYMDGDKPTLSFAQQRIWRRGTFRYKYRAHEVPIPVDGWGEIAYTDFTWEHRPPAGREWKSDYTLERLRLDIKESPDDPRPLFYLGRLHTNRKEWTQGRDTLCRYLEMPGRDEGDAWYNLAYCHAGLEDKHQQIKALYQACASQPDRREYWCALAGVYHAGGQDHIALGLLKCAMEQPSPARGYVRHGWYGSAIYDLAARCLWKLGRYDEGEPYAEKAAELSPGDARLEKNLLWFKNQRGDMDAFYTLYGAMIHSGAARHRAIAELVEGPSVLDVGCGTGDLLALLQDRDWQLFATDVSAVAIDMAKDRGIEAYYYHKSGLMGAQHDTIVMSQVLEHVDNDQEMVKRASNALVDGGKLIVSVPKNGSIPAPDHKREYTEASLRELLSAIGDPVLHSWPGEQHRLLMSVRK